MNFTKHILKCILVVIIGVFISSIFITTLTLLIATVKMTADGNFIRWFIPFWIVLSGSILGIFTYDGR